VEDHIDKSYDKCYNSAKFNVYTGELAFQAERKYLTSTLKPDLDNANVGSD